MSDELNPTPVETPPAPDPLEPQATEPASVPVDTAPDPASLDPEVKRLQEVRDKARADAEYWRREKAQARADYFKSRQQPFVPQAVPPQASEPQPQKQEDFDDYAKYQSAHAKFVADLVDYRTNAKIQSWEQQQVQRQAEIGYQQRMISLKEKIDKGASYIITQMVFSARVFGEFVDRARGVGIRVPIIPGIKPVTAARPCTRPCTMTWARNVSLFFCMSESAYTNDCQDRRLPGPFGPRGYFPACLGAVPGLLRGLSLTP